MTEKLTFDQALSKTLMVESSPQKDITSIVYYTRSQFSMAKYQLIMILLHLSALMSLQPLSAGLSFLTKTPETFECQ